MKMKKTLLSIVALLIVSLSFGAGASAQEEEPGIGGGPKPPYCIPGKGCAH